MTIFNSDILNTFTSDEKIRKQCLEEFVFNTKALTKELDLPNLLFSFYSTDNIE